MAEARYDMGLSFAGTAIPDPSGWDVSIESLDASAERDGTGELHRDMVAEKMNFSFRYNAIPWERAAVILNLMTGQSFTAVTPNPYVKGGTRSGTYYVGGRSMKTIYYWKDTEQIALCDLTFNIIEF